MDKIKFSVVIPAYKATYLEECLDSVLKQTYPYFEIIILNDASPEKVNEIVDSYTDSRIFYFENEVNIGAVDVVKNWNKCLSLSTGDYIICMGDDDKLLPDCLDEYLKLIRQFPNVAVYHGWTEIIDENSLICDIQEPRPIIESVYSMMYYRWKGRKQYIGDFLFNRKKLKQNGGFVYFPMAWGSDDATAYMMAKNGIVNTQVPVFQYRVNSQTISKSGNVFLKLQGYEAFVKWIDVFLQEKPIDHIDLIHYNLLLKEKDVYFKRNKRDWIINDIKDKGFLRLVFWLGQYKKYGLGKQEMFMVILYYLKFRF